MLFVVRDGQDIRVIQRSNNLVFANCSPLSAAAIFFVLCTRYRLETDASKVVLDRHVFREPILIAWTISNEITEHIVADST